MNIKKIGLTALAASLVSVSANAGEISVSGGASMNVTGHTGEGRNVGTSFTMGNQLTFTGSGELDNGLTASVSFVIDQGDDTLIANSPFDSHSVTISSDAMGSLTLAGEGGGTAHNAVAGTAAGNLWDAFDGLGTLNGVSFATDLLQTASAGNNGFVYTSPELTDGLTFVGSYQPQGSNRESGTGYGVNYTGFDGLTLNYATADVVGTTTTLSGDSTAMKASYVYGSFTGTYSNNDHDEGGTATDVETTSFAVSYTVSDELSITYGEETHESGTAGDQDAELSGISFAYTAGGMTLSGSMKDGENLVYGTNTVEDREQWTLGASFAF
ncbi:porin [Candidatus Pelagibacter bacterium nBUS_33]|uniref:porin n=1 Tax=Candidatus Pelagibacter bacterium nBUS_33 TaxID=3374193 RepID=UPI003EBA16D9